MECESRIIEENCGCVQFYMPRLSENTKICNQKDFKCYDKLSTAIKRTFNQTFACACLPGCFEISYKPSVYISELGNGTYLMQDKELTEQGLNRWVIDFKILFSKCKTKTLQTEHCCCSHLL